MSSQPILDHGFAVILRPIHIQNEALGLRVQVAEHAQQVDELLAIDVVPDKTDVHILVIIGAVRPENVKRLRPLPTPARNRWPSSNQQ